MLLKILKQNYYIILLYYIIILNYYIILNVSIYIQ